MEPLTPLDCDLRAFPTMPLDAVRLFGSEFHAVATDAAWRAGVTLWLRSWHQIPAASLPDDDSLLARLAEFGRDLKSWRKVRQQALHGWVKCSDGRLYHPVVAEIALASWKKRVAFKERSAKGNGKRWASKKDEESDPSAILEGDNKDHEKDSLSGPKERKGKERDSSDTKVSGGDPPAGSDSDKFFWDNAKAFLGKSKSAKIGQWVRDYGRERTAGAIAGAQIERAVDPVPYIEAILRKPNLRVVGDYDDGF